MNLTIFVLLAAPALSFPASPAVDGLAVDSIDPRVWCLHEDKAGALWFGTNGAGVFRQHKEGLTQFTLEHGLTGNDVRSIVGDGKGGVLVTANGGVARFDGESFAPLEIVMHSGEDGWALNADDVWLVADVGAGFVCRFDGEKLHQLELSGAPAEAPARAEDDPVWYDPMGVYHVSQDRRGHAWIGTAGAGLCRYDGTSLAWMYEKQLTMTPSGGEFGIRSIYEDRSGDYWICTTRQRFDIAEKSSEGRLAYTVKPGLPEAASDSSLNYTFAPSITEDQEGALWMACGSDGIWKFDGKEVTKYPLVDGAYVLTVLCDSSGKIWLGTLEHGAFGFEGGRFRKDSGQRTVSPKSPSDKR